MSRGTLRGSTSVWLAVDMTIRDFSTFDRNYCRFHCRGNSGEYGEGGEGLELRHLWLPFHQHRLQVSCQETHWNPPWRRVLGTTPASDQCPSKITLVKWIVWNVTEIQLGWKLIVLFRSGMEALLLQNMIKEVKGWSCSVCGHHSTSTAAKSDIKKHVWNKHLRHKLSGHGSSNDPSHIDPLSLLWASNVWAFKLHRYGIL